MTHRRRPSRLLTVAFWLLVGVLFITLARPADARPPAPECWWEGPTLHAINLPDEWSLTFSPYPTGMSHTESTWVQDYATGLTAYFWTRGGPYEALFKPGKQLNDYKPVCVA